MPESTEMPAPLSSRLRPRPRWRKEASSSLPCSSVYSTIGRGLSKCGMEGIEIRMMRQLGPVAVAQKPECNYKNTVLTWTPSDWSSWPTTRTAAGGSP